MGDSHAGTRVTNSRCRGERNVDVWGTGVQFIGDCVLAAWASDSLYFGDSNLAAETVGIRDMGDGAASTGAHALENDEPNG